MKYFTIILLLIATTAACGCSDSTTSGTNSLTDELDGYVTLYDSYGNQQLDPSGVKVECEGTSFSSISDNNGYWSIKNLPSRTYSLQFSKPGYGTMKNTSYSFLGGGTVIFDGGTPMTLMQPPSYDVSLDAVIAPSYWYDDSSKTTYFADGSLYFHLAPPPHNYHEDFGILIVHGKNPAIDIEKPETYVGIIDDSYYKELTLTDSNLSATATLVSGKFSSYHIGETVYFRAYSFTPVNYRYPLSYYDAAARRTVYSPYGKASKILSGVIVSK